MSGRPVEEATAGIAADRIPRFLFLQVAFAAVVAGLIIAVVTTSGISIDGSLPAWYGWGLVIITAIWAVPTTLFWRIRPIGHGKVHDYRATIAIRVGVAILPAVVGLVFFAFSGSWPVVVLGAFASMVGLAASMPSGTDFVRHRELWDRSMPLPPDHVWGSAHAEEVAPWEDPDDHGHGLFDH
ncbi:MAG: hypothetical protein HKN01_01850 [Acidimicrobiia bacterium]|nr:hypothetical protein [Acidimicrobiia bacterium]NNK92091.1 hypothetical protein [Acidimicrobiia bacterium]